MTAEKDKLIEAEDRWRSIASRKGYVCARCGAVIERQEYPFWSLRTPGTCDYCTAQFNKLD
jgi:DNA-directed RNA polymerase subunit RPC12/RpoP